MEYGNVQANFLKDNSLHILGTSGSIEIDREKASKFQITPTGSIDLTVANLLNNEQIELDIESGYNKVSFPTDWLWQTVDYSMSSFFSYDDWSTHYSFTKLSGFVPTLEPAGINSILLKSVDYGEGAQIFATQLGTYRDSYKNDSATVLYVKFNETDGAFVDSSIKNHTITNTNVTCDTSVKKFGAGSGLFDGATTNLQCAASTDWQFGLDDYTVEFFLKYTTLPGDHANIVGMQGDIPWSFLVNSDGTMRHYIHPTSLNTTLTYNDGNWHHCAVIKHNGTVYITKDGVLDSSFANSTNQNSNAILEIGKNTNGEWFTGNIDNIRISKIARWTTFPFTVPTDEYPANWSVS